VPLNVLLYACSRIAVAFDETFIHRAENATRHDRIILFRDIERPLASSR
jgi:aspartyl/asparaginyl beta-hydroxylase (cupin superfamily)